MVLLRYPLCSAFAKNDHGTRHVFELSVRLTSNYFASAIWTWFVITMWTLMYVRYLWTICELWCSMSLVMLNHVRSWLVCWLVWDPSWFYWTTGFIWAHVWIVLLQYLSFGTWKSFLQKTWAILFIPFFSFQVGIWVVIILDISNTCPFFLNSFFE